MNNQTWIPDFLRKLAAAVESGAVGADEVAQAMLRPDTYTVENALLEYSNGATRDDRPALDELLRLASLSEHVQGGPGAPKRPTPNPTKPYTRRMG